jgi:DNA-binding response OmpR family regulator
MKKIFYKILVVDDDAKLLQAIKGILEGNRYGVVLAETGFAAIEKVKQELPDLIILDLMLPDIHGIDVCKILREQDSTKSIPIIMLTGKTALEEKVAGLMTGSDDYITKPFASQELLARIKAVLRRAYFRKGEKEATLEKGGISIDTEKFKVTVKGKDVPLSKTEFDLLHLFMSSEGKTLTKEDITEEIMGYREFEDTGALNMHVSRLRKKLGKPGAKHIKTIRGIGYKFSAG